ncbi:hypothetical protein GCM10008098_14370 [Rhodanobacter panaciterrae]|uniref:DUF2894 domain-containing protein n=1 Tax=Rhodanobacter panaciterrae TaxID=490572 RepID=A0ABQ2ZQI5_9GAMM|nr:DUF2894 domain-containing protein [Rhodanobacter panaciterrae]GGY22354.1 hypothetical protein GCM10008098_14370 [Rhodanobacter panaciterrae]
MSNSGTRARAILDTWREQGADRLNPLRFHFIEVLERRAASHDGEARRLLDNRLFKLIEAYADDLEIATSNVDATDSVSTSCAPAHGALAELIDHIAKTRTAHGDDHVASDAALKSAALPTLDALDEFRKIWSEVRTDSQVRQSLEQVPANAGPLNSGSLVHRSLTLMRELSPGYLQQFLAYVDTLSWMEQMSSGGASTAMDAPRAASARKRARAKPRG